MKIFAVYSVVKFENNQTLLNNFREKYDEPYNAHITFKQPVYTDEAEIDNVKKILSKLHKPKSKIDIKLNSIKESAGLLMLEVKKNEMLADLQNRIMVLLSEHTNYVDATTKQYEINFEPHITVARNINKQNILLVKHELEKILPLKASVNSITLAIVSDISPKESRDHKNLTEYKF